MLTILVNLFIRDKEDTDGPGSLKIRHALESCFVASVWMGIVGYWWPYLFFILGSVQQKRHWTLSWGSLRRKALDP